MGNIECNEQSTIWRWMSCHVYCFDISTKDYVQVSEVMRQAGSNTPPPLPYSEFLYDLILLGIIINLSLTLILKSG